MVNCRRCGTNSNGTGRFCPACGAPAGVAGGVSGAQIGHLARPLIEGFLDWAEDALRAKAKAKIGSFQNKVQYTWGGCPSAGPVPGNKEPNWYAEARKEQQPKLSPAEIAVRQADARDRAQRAEKMLQQALESMQHQIRSI